MVFIIFLMQIMSVSLILFRNTTKFLCTFTRIFIEKVSNLIIGWIKWTGCHPLFSFRLGKANIPAAPLRALLEIWFQTRTNRPLLVQTSFLSLRSKCKQEEECKIKQCRRTLLYIDIICLKSRCRCTVSLNVINLWLVHDVKLTQ